MSYSCMDADIPRPSLLIRRKGQVSSIHKNNSQTPCAAPIPGDLAANQRHRIDSIIRADESEAIC
jgi:hypothetical protein